MVTWRCSLAGYSVRFIPGRSGVQIPPPLPFLKKPKWTFSSVGQSSRLITGWSGVRVPEGPPFTFFNFEHGEIPKRLKGSVLKTDRGSHPRGFKSLFLRHFFHRGMEQLVARRAHNPEAVGSSPAPATNGPVV